MNKLISIVNPTFNESENIGMLIDAIHLEMAKFLDTYKYEHFIIENASTDNTVQIIKEYYEQNKQVKLIVNSKNFGLIKSPMNGLFATKVDAVIPMASEFQDPLEFIEKHIKNWEEGYKISIEVKNQEEESWLFYNIRKLYYKLVDKLLETKLIENFTGTGLFIRKIVDIVLQIDHQHPYFRGIISKIGFEKALVHFKQPTRKRSFTKNNFYTLYDIGKLGLTSYSKIPLRIARLGFAVSIISLIMSILYVILKLSVWYNYPAGNSPTVIGLFFLVSIQLFLICILVEYIGFFLHQCMNRPLVVEPERVNF